jgi:hypothetical protein
LLLRVLAFLLCAVPAWAEVELHLTFRMLEKVISQQMFTADGRKYVRGSQTAKCSYAYLEAPQIGETAGRLIVRAKFTGRSAMDFLGRCVGMGESFDVVILATPYVDQTLLRLKDVVVEPADGRKTLFSRRVCASLAAELPRQMQFDIAPDAKRILEAPSPDFPHARAVSEFRVPRVFMTVEAVVVALAFRLRVE